MAQFSKVTEKAIAAYIKAENSPAWARASAYVIIAPKASLAPGSLDNSRNFGKIKVLHPADGAGPLRVFVWDCKGTDLQMGTASGYGYDKLSAALQGIVFDGVTLTDHPQNWKSQLEEAGYTIVQAI